MKIDTVLETILHVEGWLAIILMAACAIVSTMRLVIASIRWVKIKTGRG